MDEWTERQMDKWMGKWTDGHMSVWIDLFNKTTWYLKRAWTLCKTNLNKRLLC